MATCIIDVTAVDDSSTSNEGQSSFKTYDRHG